MTRGKPIEGFIYSNELPGRGRVTVPNGAPVNDDAGFLGYTGWLSCTRSEWRDLMRQVIESGGWVRREVGETFIHDRTGSLVAEAYALIPTPKVQS